MTNLQPPRSFRLALGAIALAATSALTASAARADYSIQTSITNATFDGAAAPLTALAAGSTFSVGNANPTTVTVGAAGGYSFTDAAGSIFYVLNDGPRTSTTTAVPNEQIYVQNPSAVVGGGAIDMGTLNFEVDTLVTNNGATGTFTQTGVNVALDLAGNDRTFAVTTGSLVPTTLNIGGTMFTASLPQATSGDINSNSNGAVATTITAVPEPASVAMLGLGLVGLAGYSIRRRSK